jgi:HEAT repeat protein
MPQPVPFQTVLAALRDDSRPFPPRYLHEFSDLTPENLQALLETWPAVSVARKRSLLEDLETLHEADTLVSFDVLAKPLLRDADPQVRAAAIRLLWECEDTDLIPAFIEILERDSDSQVQATAATALGQFIYLGELEEISQALLQQVEEHLLEAVNNQTNAVLVRRRALEALGASSRPEIPALIEAAYDRPGPDWKISALFAMGRSGDTRWEKLVLANLRASNDEIRLEAVRAAGELELTSARASLLDALEDEEDADIRREIIWALSKIGGPGIQERLLELLDAEEDEDEADFLEEALDNLAFTESLFPFGMFSFEPKEEDDDDQRARQN